MKISELFLKTPFRVICTAALTLAISSPTWASCTYSVTNNWGSGFTGEIKVTNDSGQNVTNWSVSWQETNALVTNAWNVTFAGSNPYTATSLSWNGTLAPKASASFGFQATGVPGTPKVTGALCGTAASSVSTKSSVAPNSSAASSKTVSSLSNTLSSLASSKVASASSIATGSGISNLSSTISSQLRFKRVRLHLVGSTNCVSTNGGTLISASCGAGNQEWRLQVLNSEYLSVVDNSSGQCLTVSGSLLKLSACTNAPDQQFAYSGTAASGYNFKSFSTGQFINSSSGLSSAPVRLEVLVQGDADRLAVIVGERPTGWATMAANIIIPGTTPPNGSEKTRYQAPTTGGGSWESAKVANYANVAWFKPADFIGSNRETNISALAKALSGSESRIIVLEQGNYDFSLSNPKLENSCTAKCSSGATYIQVGGFCNCTTTSCTVGGYKDATRTFDIGSNKSLIGLGSGAKFTNTMMRAVKSSNIILRNLSYSELPGDVRQWNDALLFYPADHVWVDHVSFAGFGRGAIVLSGSRVADGSSFYAYRDTGWMTFSWIHIDSSENWRCGGKEDSPYPMFTTNNPALTFDHAVFYKGHGRNPAIDGEYAHFINSAWIDVTDGLDGRGNANLRVEGSYFDGDIPIRMDDPLPPKVFAPWDASLLSDKRQQNIFSSTAWASLVKDWGNRKLNIGALNTNASAKPSYPYSLDASPTDVLNTVNAGSGVGKIAFPNCSLTSTNKASYSCK